MIRLSGETATCAVCGWTQTSPDRRVLVGAVRAHLETHRGSREGWAIRVWNCQARLVRLDPSPDGWQEETIDLRRFSPSVRRKIAVLLRESVRRAGGALNLSGTYPPCEELLELLAQHSPRPLRGRMVALWLYPDDERAIDQIQRALGLSERSAAIRNALRLACQALAASTDSATDS